MLLKSFPYIAYLALYLFFTLGSKNNVGTGDSIATSILCVIISSVSYFFATKRYKPISAWFMSILGIYLILFVLRMLLLPFTFMLNILFFPFKGSSGWGSNQKVQCMNCGCTLKKGLLGSWVPRGVSTCEKMNQRCVGVEIP